MKCDLHVHTVHSGMCTVPVARRFCKESYNQPEAVYENLKRQGMDLVTITDHDSIAAAESLRGNRDFFVSEEVTCTMPSGTESHIGVYDIGDRTHIEIQRRRDDLPRLLSYLNENRILFSINHVFSGLTGRRELSDFEWFDREFPVVEALNGAMLAAANHHAAVFAAARRKSIIGGSDAHTMPGLGSAWTEVRGASNKQEFLQGIREGRSIAVGQAGSFLKLNRDVLLICRELIAERRVTLLLTPLLVGLPAVLFVNYWFEAAFARRWSRKAGGCKSIGVPIVSWFGEEAPL